ncbi:hypothetical protein GCM10027570_55170 [Streptomonospora sediminis]
MRDAKGTPSSRARSKYYSMSLKGRPPERHRRRYGQAPAVASEQSRPLNSVEVERVSVRSADVP